MAVNSLLKAIQDGHISTMEILQKHSLEKIVKFSEGSKKPIFNTAHTANGQSHQTVTGFEVDDTKRRVKLGSFKAEQSLNGYELVAITPKMLEAALDRNAVHIGHSINNACVTCHNLEINITHQHQAHLDTMILITRAGCRLNENSICPDQTTTTWHYRGVKDLPEAFLMPPVAPKVELEDIKFELNVLLNDDFGLF